MQYAQTDVGLCCLHSPVHGGAEVVEILLQPIQPAALLETDQAWCRPLCILREVPRVPLPYAPGLSALCQPLCGVLADRLQHGKAWLAVRVGAALDQSLLDQR